MPSCNFSTEQRKPHWSVYLFLSPQMPCLVPSQVGKVPRTEVCNTPCSCPSAPGAPVLAVFCICALDVALKSSLEGQAVCLSVRPAAHARAPYIHIHTRTHAHMEIPFLGEALAVCHRAPGESREVSRARDRFQAPIFNPDPSLCQGCNLPAVVCSPWSHPPVINRPPKEDTAVHHISYL